MGRWRGRLRGRLAAGGLAWAGAFVVVAVAAHPESCPPATATQAREAAQDGVDWIAANQRADGSFLYRYDEDEGDLGGYNIVRHAGTLLALEQAAAAGLDVGDSADRATEWAVDRLTELGDDRLALTADTGATGLLVAALVERRQVDPGAVDDDLLRSLGAFLATTVTEGGAVTARWDLEADEPVAGSRSPFFTGEIMWALARLHAALPGEGWDEPARRISTYVVTERDDAERRFPPVSDHWGAYGWDEISAWPAELTDAELAYTERQAGLFGLQTRYESQRREDGSARLLRGPYALPAGLGTLGEGLGGIRRLAAREPDLDVDRDTVDERLACVAGMLVERQTHSDDPRLDGAWFRLGVTQVDDQQHAVSALLAALPILESP